MKNTNWPRIGFGVFLLSALAVVWTYSAIADDAAPGDKEPAIEGPADEAPKEDAPQEKPEPDEPAKEEPKPTEPPNEQPKESPTKDTPKIEVKIEPVLSGLYNPCGLAVQPGSNKVFISDSGALRVIKFDPAKPNASEDVIAGFPKDTYGKGPTYDVGPLGLAFMSGNTLIVGGGGNPDGEELLRIYELPSDGRALNADEMKYKLGPIAKGEQSSTGEGNFYAVAATPTAIYATSNGDDKKGWLLRSEIKNNKPEELKPFIATKEATSVNGPVGLAISPKGRIVVGQMGAIDSPADSLLTWYDYRDGKMLLNLKTGLHDIAGLAYSPRGRLYAVDFSWADAKQGGLYRMDGHLDDEGKWYVTPVKVCDLDKPAALTFAPDGTLYVAIFGTAKEGSDEKPGQLIKIVGDL